MMARWRVEDASWDLALWSLRDRSADAIIEHVRRSPRLKPLLAAPALPDGWSDRLFLAKYGGIIEELYSIGVIHSAYPAAYLAQEAAADGAKRGNIFTDPDFSAATGIPLGLVKDCIDISAERNGLPIPLDARRMPMQWISLGEGRVAELVRAVREEFSRQPVTDVIVVPTLGRGGAEKVAFWHYKLLEATGRSPLLLLCDGAAVEEKYQDARILKLIACEAAGGNFIAGRPMELLVELLAFALEEIDPETVHIVQSFVGFNWLQAVARGDVPKGRSTVFVSLFCPHIHESGEITGYQHFLPFIDAAVDRYVFDNRRFAEELGELFAIAARRCDILDYPAERVAPVERSVDGTARVLWAGRFDHQKQPHLVPGIAAGMPDVEFHMFGSAVLNDTRFGTDGLPPNVVLRGPYDDFYKLPLEEFDLFLMTSLFEGLPNVLIEALSTGLPVVAPDVGGISEIVSDGVGALVADPRDVAAYREAIGRMLDSERNAAARAEAIEFVGIGRSLDVFLESGATWFSGLGAITKVAELDEA